MSVTIAIVVGSTRPGRKAGEVALTFHDDFENMSAFTPGSHHLANLTGMTDQVETRAAALQTVRQPVAAV